MMSRILAYCAAAVVVALGAVYQWKQSDVFGYSKSATLEQFTERLGKVPKLIGQWEVISDKEIPPEEFKASNCDGYKSYTFQNRETNEVVDVFLASGTARHITIHTPDWCYPAAGYGRKTDIEPALISCEEIELNPEFLTARFVKRKQATSAEIPLQVFWSFSYDGEWTAVQSAKVAFAGRDALYKIYLINHLPSQETRWQQVPSVKFIEECLPTINQYLFGQPETSGQEDTSAA